MRDATNPPGADVAIAPRIDSCALRDVAAAQPVRNGASSNGDLGRWTGRVRQFPGFSLFVPDSATVVPRDPRSAGLGLTWAGCTRCRFEVRVHSDSGVTLDTRIAQLVAEQHRIDSVNNDPHTTAFEFNDIDGPPVRVRTSRGQAYLIDEDCGDCASSEVMFGYAGRLATIDFGADDDVPQGGRHMCEMAVVAETFTWRE